MPSLTSQQQTQKGALQQSQFSKKLFDSFQPKRSPSSAFDDKEKAEKPSPSSAHERKAALHTNRHSARNTSSAYTPQQPLSLPSSATRKEDNGQKNSDNVPTPNERLRSNRFQDRLARQAETKSQQGNGSNQAQQKIQQETRALVRRFLTSALNGILSLITVGTGGVSWLITGIPHAVVLTDVNLQLFWGSYLTKGKSVFFPPLKWPVPIPLLPDIILHIVVLLIDLLLLIFLAIGCFFFIAIIYAATKVKAGFFSTVYSYFTDPFFQKTVDFMFENFF